MIINYLKEKPYKYLLHRNISVFINKKLNKEIPNHQLIHGELADGYVPGEVENRPLENWFFQPRLKTTYESFTMLLPPPNITGTLHLGHALTATIQDVIVKWKRMNGIDTLWIPGMDHAGIATQVIVEKKIWAESRRTRHDIGHDEFEREVWKWKREKSSVIGAQLRRMGVSMNWESEFFTMDPRQSKAVVEAFVKLHEDGLIYESEALVNWSCSLRSAISDIEVEHVEIPGPTHFTLPGRTVEFGHLTQFAYKLSNDLNEEVIVATTRPETMLGDVALAVHPNDHRYTKLIGKHVVHPFRHTLLPIIADEFVDANFGTGIVKLTPGHSNVDFDVAKRHDLPILSVFDEQGKLFNCGEEFNGMDRFDAREKVLSALDSLHLMKGRKEHAMSLPLCGRSKDVVELILKPQWFVDCKQMAAVALDNVKNGKIQIIPKPFEKTWFNWLENIRPWCISRQLWWGHRIPAFYCTDQNGKIQTVIARSKADAVERLSKTVTSSLNESEIKQVDDVLDTWFSSALLPLSVFNWPTETHSRYPLDVMETGHDILFFWVARMAMLCTHLSGEIPFEKVLLHAIVCDSHGRKMSKSLGNVIAPEDIVEGRTLKDLEDVTTNVRNQGFLSTEESVKAIMGQRKMFPNGIHACGIDALRFTLCSYNLKNHFINFDVQECKTNKFFGNKLWQATKFTLKWRAVLRDGEESKAPRSSTVAWENSQDIRDMDKWILSRLNFMLTEVNEALSGDNFHVATAALKNFLYYEFCDVYLESTKQDLRNGNVIHLEVLEHCLMIGLRTLAPFMPHLSQHLYAHLAQGMFTDASRLHAQADVMDEYYPLPENRYRDEALERNVGKLMDVVIAIRRLKKIFNVTAKHNPKVIINGADEFLKRNSSTIMDLSLSSVLEFEYWELEGYISDRIDSIEIHLYVPEELQRALCIEAEKLQTKRDKLNKELEKLQTNMGSPLYSEKVSPTSHQKNLNKIGQLEDKITRLDYIKSISEKQNSLAQ